ARAKGEEFKSRGGPIQMFDLRPSVALAKTELDRMSAHLATTKDKMLSTAMMFRDGFADAIADAVMSGKLSFRSFADFVIAELIRIQARKMFTQLLGAAVGGFSAASSGGTYTGGARISSPSFNLGPAAASGATVVNQTINFSVSAIDARDATRFLHEQKGTIAQVVAEAARSSGGYRRALAGA
ncbi:MAG: phage tail tape measure C-terminal domain-containing protein, partial [Longimicrobiales bacterium]|nr:phage tail tape measure C-terminal domain-containing protein [Longimicrobiales bacterium]